LYVSIFKCIVAAKVAGQLRHAGSGGILLCGLFYINCFPALLFATNMTCPCVVVPVSQFKKLAELNSIEAGQTVDVIGVVDSVSAWGLINRKDGSETRKRSLVLRDDSGCSVEVRVGMLYMCCVRTPAVAGNLL
jgi:hypothetical protein